MAETVGQHSVAAFTSPVNGTTPIDANTVRGNDNTVRSAYVDHDADPGIHVQSSSLASRPTAGTVGRKWITVSSGRYQLWYDDGARWHEVASDAVNVDCLADANLTKGDVVKITGFNNGQNLPTVNKVSASTDTAFGIVENTVTSGNIVQIVNTGLIEDVDTNGYAVGTILYPNSSGAWTTTKPTSGNYQPAGYVLRGNTNNGVLYVEFSAPRIVERSDNTASTLVLRDASGNFSAGTITAGALTSTGLVTFASLKGTGATTVTNILDEDNMASDSATALATQQSIKAYVDAKVATVDTLAEVLANGNTTGANDIIVNAGQKIRTPLIASQNNATAITIADTTGALTFASALADSNLATISTAGKVANSATTATSANTASAIVARDASGNFTAGTITAALTGNASTATTLQTARNINGVSFNGSADITVTAAAGTLTGTTLASGVTASSLTSVGTLTSLTVSGDLTVDTSTLKVDSANNRVGIGTASPAVQLHVETNSTTASTNIRVVGGSSNTSTVGLAPGAGITLKNLNTTNNTYNGIYSADAGDNNTSGIVFQNNNDANNEGSIAFLTRPNGGSITERMFIDSSGNLAVDTNTLYVDAANNRVGVGTASPGSTFEVSGGQANFTQTSADSRVLVTAAGVANTVVGFNNSGVTSAFGMPNNVGYVTIPQAYPLVFGTDSVERLRIDASGNLGLGVTPSAWALSGLSAMQIKNASFFGYANNAYMSANEFIDAASSPKYIATAAATRYQQGSGAHTWYTAASGTAGNTISFTQAMTLDVSGNLGIGTTSPDGRIYASETTNGLAYFTFRNPSTGGSAVARLRVGNSGSENAFTIDVHGSSHATLANITRIFNQFTAPLVLGTNGAERARITSGGYFKASDDGTYENATGSFHEFRNTANAASLYITATNAGFTSSMVYGNTTIAAGTGFNLVRLEANSVEQFRVRGDGTIYAQNTTVQSISDIRLKENVSDATDGLSIITALRPVRYDWKAGYGNDRKNQLGFIAQEVEAVFPEAVSVWEMDEPTGEVDEDGKTITEKVDYKTVGPGALIPVLVKAIQELEARIAVLEAGA